MGSEFEPAVRTEDTPEAHIVVIDLPGFRREDMRVQVNNKGSLVISGERGPKEMEGGRSEKMQKGGCRFRKVISVPSNLNFDGITAKFRDDTLRVSLPLLHVPDQQNQQAVPGSEKTDQSLQSKVESSSPAGQQDSIKEQPVPARPVQDEQSPTHPEASRLDDDKEKPNDVAAEESKKLLEKKSAEAPKQAAELFGEPPISSHAQAVSDEMGCAQRSESIQSKSKQGEETLLQECGGQKSGKTPECRHPPQENKKEGCADHGRKPAEKSEEHEGKKDDESCSTWLTNKFPDPKGIKFPASCSSTFSKRGVLIASSVLVLSIGVYITYKSRRRHHI